MTSVLNMIDRRGERVWYRMINRSTNASTGENVWTYIDNKSCVSMLTMYATDENGRTILLPSGRLVLWGKPVDYWNDSKQLAVNDEIIRFPNNYSNGSSLIYRVEDVKTQPLANQSIWYVRASIMLTKARD